MAKHRSKTPQDNCDLRIALLNRIAAKVSQDYYRAAQSDPLRHYAYAWFHGKTCIYVGKGGDADQWLEFLVNHKTENFDAHRYVMQHGDELEPFFVVSNVTETAAFAVEHYLIQHFKRKRDGGSLFNSKYESLPSLLGPENESVYDQRKGAERVVIPPNMRPMCKQQYAPMKFQNDQVITFNPDKYDARKSIVP
jgi:hypothetical protein